MMICALPVATRFTVTVVPDAVAVALVGSVDATVKSLLVAPVGAIFTVNVLVPPAVPVLVVGVTVTPVTATAVISFTSIVLASPTLNSVENVTMSLLPPS